MGRKFWFSDSGGCTIVGVGGREKQRAEERLRACGVLGPKEEINGVVEVVSFDDTLGKLREVFEDGHPRTVECPILKSVVFRAKVERHLALHLLSSQ